MTMLELILITSFSSLGFFISCQEPFVLSGFRDFLGDLLGGTQKVWGNETFYEFKHIGFIWKPFIGCPVCMASVWGIMIYSLLGTFTTDSIYELPILILCSCCLNFIIFNNLIKKHLF